MKRRNFIKSTALGSAALIVPNKIQSADFKNRAEKNSSLPFVDRFNNKPIDVKLNIKPIFAERIHDAAYGGPCRWDPMEQMTPEFEIKRFKSRSEAFFTSVKNNLADCANLMEPVSIELWRKVAEYEKGDIMDPLVWEKLDNEANDIDLFVTSYRVNGLAKYGKPVVIVGNFSGNLDWASSLRNAGVEGFAAYNWEELIELIRLLQVRKAVQSTKILRVTDSPNNPPDAILADISMEKLKENYGVDYQNVSYKEFFREMDFITKNPEKQKEAVMLNKKLVSGAKEIFMNKDLIINDIYFYLTVKSVMQKYNCNAFVIKCFEMCTSHIAADRKITPCLPNALLRDEGYPAACEGDVNALFTTMTLMYLAKKPVYMGNTWYTNDNMLTMRHDAVTLKMKGFSEPDLPYEIQPFVHETAGGFGTTIRYDFKLDIGQEVTISRSNPVRRKILLAKGNIKNGLGFREHGCSLGLEIDIKGTRELFHLAANIGNHLVFVYGDYMEEMRKLSEILKYEVLEVK